MQRHHKPAAIKTGRRRMFHVADLGDDLHLDRRQLRKAFLAQRTQQPWVQAQVTGRLGHATGAYSISRAVFTSHAGVLWPILEDQMHAALGTE